ncbi:MAG: hypothetical protein HYZ79_04610 [Candidatus Melainabacteria bacterium]|nr:hypothetical protein [Candidatus Melainabacteria bacterium]
MALNVDKVLSFLYQAAVGKGFSVTSLKSLNRLDLDGVAQTIETEGKADELGLDTSKPIVDQLNEALSHKHAESRLLAVLLSQTDSNNVIDSPDMVFSDVTPRERRFDGLGISLKNKSLEVRLGGDLVDLEVTNDGNLKVTPKAPISETQQVVIYVKEDDKFIKFNLAPNSASSTASDPASTSSPEKEDGQGQGSLWKSIGRWSIFGISLYSLLGIFRSEKNWFGIILGALGTGLTAFWSKIKGATGAEGAQQKPQAAEQGAA